MTRSAVDCASQQSWQTLIYVGARSKSSSQGAPLSLIILRKLSRPMPSRSSIWSSSIVTVTLTSFPVNSNGPCSKRPANRGHVRYRGRPRDKVKKPSCDVMRPAGMPSISRAKSLRPELRSRSAASLA